MSAVCDSVRERLAAYSDGEMSESQMSALEAHLRQCADCHAVLEEERRLRDLLRADPLLPPAPDSLRKRLSADAAPDTAPPHLRKRIEAMIGTSKEAASGNRIWRPVVAAAAAMLVMVSLVFAYTRMMDRREFARVAVDTHLRRQSGSLPLEIVSDSTEEVSRWFVGKVPFHLKLPDYQVIHGEQKPYSLEGARLVGFRNDYAANVSYRMNDKLITLLAASDTVAEPSGDEVIMYRNIAFHFQSRGGLKVIAWKDRGLSYALVSDLEARGQQSCMVCHAESERKDFLELK